MDKPWISVKEKIFPVDDYVLICYEFLDNGGRFVNIDHFSEFTPKSYMEGVCPLSDTTGRYRKMIAWMPIPDPPKGE
jgi:hypothetical protein